MENEKIQQNVYLCKKCLEKGEYFIPLYDKIEDFKVIKFKCSKEHNIEYKDIIRKPLDDNLKSLLGECQKHKEVICAWDDVDKKNICFYEVGENMRNNKDYLLLGQIYPEYTFQFNLSNHINLMKKLLKKFKNDRQQLKEEIIFLEMIVSHIEMNFNLFNLKIKNYQIIKNVLNSINIFPEEDIMSLDKKRLMHNYGDLCMRIIKKKYEDIKIKELNLKYDITFDAQILNNENYSNNIKYIVKYSRNKKIDKDSWRKRLTFSIEDLNGNSINIFEFMLLQNDLNLIKDNFLVLIHSEKIIIYFFQKKITLIKLSDDLKNFSLTNLTLEHLLITDMVYSRYDDLIKINSNNILLIFHGKAYIITFNYELTLIENFSELEDLKGSTIKKAKNIYYYDGDNILQKGIIIISTDNPSRFTMYDKNMNILNDFEFRINYKDNSVLDISYNFIKKIVLIFTEDYIYQLNLFNKDISTVYDISSYMDKPKNLTKENKNYENDIKVKIIYSYNKNDKTIEEIVFLINPFMDRIYQFNWDDKILLIKKEYIYQNIYDIIPLYTPDAFNYVEKDPSIDFNVLFLASDEVIVFG